MKRKFIQEPGLSEFVYTVATTAPISLKRNLPLKLFEATNTSKGARKFAATSSFDEKKEFLECLGFKFMCVVSGIPDIWKPHATTLLRQMEKDQGSFEECFENGFYISSDRKLISALEQASSFTSSRAYIMGLELLRSKNGQSGWPIKLNRPEVDEADKIEARCNFYVRAALAIDEAIDADKMGCGLKSHHNRVLLYLYLKRRVYVTHEQIVTQFADKIPKAQIPVSIRKLLEEMLIQKHLDARRKEYTITARGIMVVNSILQYATSVFSDISK